MRGARPSMKLKTNAVSSAKRRRRACAIWAWSRFRSALFAPAGSARCHHQVPGSLRRSMNAIRFLKSQGLKVVIANVLMTENMQDYHGVQRAGATSLGTECTLDPTITPKMDGDRSILDLERGRVRAAYLCSATRPWSAMPMSSAPPPPAPDDESHGVVALQRWPYRLLRLSLRRVLSLRAVSPVLRQCAAAALYRHLARFRTAERVRSIRLRDLSSCSQCAHGSSCTRCPGLAFMEGNMRGPSTADCEKSFARTGFLRLICWRRSRMHAPARSETRADPARTGDHRQQVVGHGRLLKCCSLVATPPNLIPAVLFAPVGQATARTRPVRNAGPPPPGE